MKGVSFLVSSISSQAISEKFGKNFENSPSAPLSSQRFFGKGNVLFALVFLGSDLIPVDEITCSRKLIPLVDNSLFLALRNSAYTRSGTETSQMSFATPLAVF